MKMTYTQKQYTFTQRVERGSVLAITLMLLVILALLGTFAIRNSTQSERVMNGIRTSNVSEHAAETALRFCEQFAQQDDQSGTFGGKKTKDYIEQDKSKSITMAKNGDWAKKATWKPSKSKSKSKPKIIELPKAYHESKIPPQCIIERLDTGKSEGFIITARGFGQDAIMNPETGEVISGAETWLQSTLTQKKN